MSAISGAKLKTNGIVAGVLLVVGLGCQSPEPAPVPEYDNSQVNRWLMGAIKDSAINNAIVSQSILYPYHFVAGSDQLNGLGSKDLSVLAEHLAMAPGQVRVRRGNTSDELYERRIAFVIDSLGVAGVDTDRIEINDDHAGGRGMLTGQVLMVLEKAAKAQSFSGKREMGQTRILDLGGGGN